MHAIDLLNAAIDGPVDARSPKPQEVCCVTGAVTACIPRRNLLGPSFTSQALLRAPLSPWIGLPAARVLRYGPERKSSWLCTGNVFRPLRRVEARPLVLEGVAAPRWAGYLTTSYQKHGALAAPVNTGGRQVWLFETVLADCTDRARVADIWARLRGMQDAGWPRPVLEDLDPSPWLLGKLGPAAWLDFAAWARPQAQGARYRLLCYLLPSQAELKGETHGEGEG